MYVLDLLNDDKRENITDIQYISNESDIQFIDSNLNNFNRVDANAWALNEKSGTQPIHNEKTVGMSRVRINFPVFSLDADMNTLTDYMLEVYTYINGVKVMLACVKYNTADILVRKCTKKLANEYYEYIEIPFINPRDLCYGDDWMEFRNTILEEPTDINNTGSLLTFSITPVTYDPVRNVYIKSTEYTGGANSVLLDRYVNDDARLTISFTNNYKYTPTIKCQYEFNSVYNSLKEYLAETYNLWFPLYANFELVVMDDEDIWKQIKTDYVKIDDDYEPTMMFTRDELNFESWEEYNTNLLIKATFNIMVCVDDVPSTISLEDYVPEYEGDRFISCSYIMSDGLYLTPELFKFFIKDTNYDKKINYKLLDMNVYEITAINKIEKKIINVDRTDNYKSNIIRPVFFQTKNTNNLQIHADVNENIALNLDSYKSKVKAFRLRIEGIDFIEVGRNNSGVIFKIIGAQLPKENTSGSYYIIDENNEMVTSGYYEYI